MAIAKRARDGQHKPHKRTKRQRKIAQDLGKLDDLGDDGLTPRQKLFIEAYLGPARLNASKAAKLAGYSAKSPSSLRLQASRLLANACVQSRVRARLAGMGVDRTLILERIGLLAGSTMADMLEPDRKGEYRLSLRRAAEAGALGLIRKYTEEPGAKGMTRKVEIHDPGKYLELLAKHTGIIGDEGAMDRERAADDPGNWPIERIRDYYAQRGWPMPDALQPRPAAPGSGLVDAQGKPITRESITGARNAPKTKEERNA